MRNPDRRGRLALRLAAGFFLPALAAAQVAWHTTIDGPAQDGTAEPVCRGSLPRALEPDGDGGAFVLARASTPETRAVLFAIDANGLARPLDTLPSGYVSAPTMELARATTGDLAAIGSISLYDGTQSRRHAFVARWKADGQRRDLLVLEFDPGVLNTGAFLIAGPAGSFYGLVLHSVVSNQNPSTLFQLAADGDLAWTRPIPESGAIDLVRLTDGRLALALGGDAGPRVALFGADGTPLGTVPVGNDPARDEAIRELAPLPGGAVAAGGSSCLASDCDALAAVVAADGTLAWSRRVRPAGIERWLGMQVAGDGAGRVLLAGTHTPVGGTSRVVVAALAPDGSDLWVDDSIGGTGSGHNWPYALEPTGDGGVVVAGEVRDAAASSDYFVARFDPASGARSWLQVLDSGMARGDVPCGVTVDPASGRILVTGGAARVTGDVWTLALDPAGALLWSAFEPPLEGSDQQLGSWKATIQPEVGRLALAAGPAGEVVAAGLSGTTTGSEGLAAKVGPAGEIAWSTRFAAPAARFPDVRAVAVGPDGTAFLAGHGGVASEGYQVTALDADGAERWTRVAALGSSAVAQAVAALPDGGVLATGQARFDGNNDVLTVRYDRDGTPLWTATFDDYSETGIDVVALPGGGGAVLSDTQLFSQDPLGRTCDVLRYDAAGQETGRTRITAPSGGGALCTALAAAPRDALVVAGRADNLGLVALLGPEGGIRWQALVGKPGIRTVVRAIEVAPNGDIFAAGEVETQGRAGAWIGRLDRDGELLWERTRSEPAPTRTSFRDLALDAQGRIHAAALTETVSLTGWLEVVTYSADGEELATQSSSDLITARATDAVAITATADGRVVAASTVTAEGEGSDILVVSTPLLPWFADGFESGDTAAWSQALP